MKLKRRVTKGVHEDRLSGLTPGRLSAVSPFGLFRAGTRWLAFAHSLTRGPRRRMSAADPHAFIEALYGGKFRTFEEGVFSFDKVYRTTGGQVSVSETHLNVRLHPRFDLRVLNFHSGSAQVSLEKTTTTLLSHPGSGSRERVPATRLGSNVVVNMPSPTLHTLHVSRPTFVSHRPTFNYIHLRDRRARQGQTFESPRTNAATTSASLRPTTLELTRAFIHAPRQEFVNVILNNYLPADLSRQLLSRWTARELSSALGRVATTLDVKVWHSTSSPFTWGSWTTSWTYAEPSTRRAAGVAAETHREFRSTETLREHAPSTHALSHDARPALLHVLPPESLLLSLTKTLPPEVSVNPGGAAHDTYSSGGHLYTSSLQYVHARAARSFAREATAGTDAPQLHEQALNYTETFTREVLSSLNLFVEYVHTNAAAIERGGRTTASTPRGSEPLLRRGFEFVSVRLRGPSSEEASRRANAWGLHGQAGHLVPVMADAISARVAFKQAPPDRAPGMGSFLFTKRLLMRTTGVKSGDAMSPTVGTVLRLATGTAETVSPSNETRAARPEGMALELVRRRREEVLQLPRPGYVFTQQPRAQLEERQVITKASREEIVEVVRREVRSLTSAAPAPVAPSRADIAGLADEVYTTLARRLLVEKERLGRF